MPSKKKKYNARFPAGRIKKIMQTDEDVGKVAQAVPIIISRTLELFVESLLLKSVAITTKRNAKTLSPSHIKQCILSESRFDFLKDLVKNIPDISQGEEQRDCASTSVTPTKSEESSPNTIRYQDPCTSSSSSSSQLANPGPSNVGRRPRQSHKKDNNGQSSDSGSDHEPLAKKSKCYGNGRPSAPPANFDEELKAFVEKRNQAAAQNSANFAVPSAKTPESNNNNNSKQKFNFYAETLPVDDEEDKKPTGYSSVIQPNPEYNKSTKNFAFAAPNRGAVRPEPSLDPKEHPEALLVPKFHIDLTQGFSVRPAAAGSAAQSPVYHLDFSAVPIGSSRAQIVEKAAAPPPPPMLHTLKRSASLPDPAASGSDSQKSTDPKKRMERASFSFDSNAGQRKNEPPLLLPISLIHKAHNLKAPRMELDEDYDT